VKTVKSKNTLGSDVSVRNMIQLPENINRNSRETIIYTFFKENVFFILISIPPLCGGTNSDERFLFPLHCAIIVSRSYTTKHGRRSCRNLSRFKTAY